MSDLISLLFIVVEIQQLLVFLICFISSFKKFLAYSLGLVYFISITLVNFFAAHLRDAIDTANRMGEAANSIPMMTVAQKLFEAPFALNSFESKQVKDKGFVKISTGINFFGSLKLLHDDLSAIITEELKNIQLNKEKKQHEKLLDK